MKRNRDKPVVVKMYEALLSQEPEFSSKVENSKAFFRKYQEYQILVNNHWNVRWDEQSVGFPMELAIALQESDEMKGCLSNVFKHISPSKFFRVSQLVGLIAWSESMAVYRFDEEFAKELNQTVGTETISIDTLLHMPFKSVCLQVGSEEYLVFLDQDFSTGIYILEMVQLKDNPMVRLDSARLFLASNSMQTCVNRTVEELCRPLDELQHDARFTSVTVDDVRKSIESKRSLMTGIIQMLLYIQSENADVVIDSESDTAIAVTKKPNATTRKQCPKKVSPVVVNAGYRIGAEIRKVRRHYVSVSTGESTQKVKSASAVADQVVHGSPKSIHVRRAHWHHFWTGSRGYRQLKLRWVAPMVINSGRGELLPTLHKVAN